MANEFKVKKGLIVTGSGSTIFDVQGSQGQLFSVTDSLTGELFSVNDISGIPVMTVSSDNTINMGTYGDEAIKITGNSVSMGDSYIKRIETLDGKVKSSQQLLGEVTNLYSDSVFVPEQKTVYNTGQNYIYIYFMQGVGYYLSFTGCDNVINTSDGFLTITSPSGVESGTLTINSTYGASSCIIWLVDDTNFYNFYNSSDWQNYGYLNIYSKVIPSVNQTINFLEINKPAINLGSGDTISVDGKIGPSAVTPYVSNDSGRFSLLRDSSYSTSVIDFTFEGWFEVGLVNIGIEQLSINFSYYGSVFSINNVMNYWSAGQNTGNLDGIDFSTKIHIAATVSAISSLEAQVNLYINGVLLGSGVFYDYSGVGLPNMFGNPSYGIDPLYISAKMHEVRVQSGIVYNTNFTPPQTLERNGSTLILFNGTINPITLSNILWYNGIPINAESYTNESIIQDSVQPIAFVNYSAFNGITYPYVKESTYTPNSIGVPYTGLSNTYITPSLATYSIGDVIRYTPRDIKIVFESEDGLNSRTISFNTKSNIMDYEGIVTSLTYDSVNSNYVTVGSQIDASLSNVILIGKTSTVNDNGVVIGNNVSSNGDGNVLVGIGAATGGGSSVIIGALAYGGGQNSTSIGYGSYANTYGTVIGGNASTTKDYGVSIGYNAKNYSTNGVTIGYNQTNNGLFSGILIGSNSSSSTSSDNIGIGNSVVSNGNGSIAIGRQATTGGQWSMAIGGYSPSASFIASQAIGTAYASANSSYIYAHKTNIDFQFANQIVRYSYYISNETFTGKRYISKTNQVNSTVQTTTDWGVNGFALLRGYTANGVNGLMGLGVARIMIKATGTSLPNDWKIVEIRFLLRSLASNSDYNFTIISTTTLASGSGSNHGFWTPSLEYSNNTLVFAIDKSTNNTAIGAVAHIEVETLNIS